MSSFKDFVKQRREKQAASGGGRAAKRAEAKGSPAAPKPQPAPQPQQPVAAPRPQPPAAAPQPVPKPRGPDAKAELVNRMVPSLLASMQVLAKDPRALVAGPVEEVGQGYVLYCSAALTCLGAKQPGNKALGPGLEMPFFDFGNVRFSRDRDEMPEAGTVVATLGAPRPPPKTSATAVFVHSFADALRARGSTAERRAAADLSFRRLANPNTSVDAIAAAITAGTHRRRGGLGAEWMSGPRVNFDCSNLAEAIVKQCSGLMADTP